MAVNPLAAVFVGPGGTLLTEEEIAQAKALERRKQMQGVDTSPVGHWTQGAARVADAIAGAFRRGSLDRASAANAAYDAETYGAISPDALAAPAYPASVAAGGSTFAPEATGVAGPVNVSPEIKDGIVQTASALGIDPVDLATTISYETGGTFNPTQGGPTTKWGKHRGLIQFGEPQAAQYGVDWNNPVASQLGPDGAVTKYLRDRGVKPGMGLMDIYSTINAGAPGLYNRSDAAAGGAPGTVADKVNSQMAGHRAKAMALFADAAPTNAAAAINAVAPVQTASLDPSVGMGGPLPGADQGIGGVAHEQFPPVGTTPEALTALQDRLVTEQTTPAGAMSQPPATVDVTNVDGLSAGAGLQFVAPDGQPNPLAAAVQPQAVPPSVARVAQSLPLRAMADPNDVMVADASQTEQPTGAFPPAPASGGGQTGPDMALLVRAATDPRASDRTKQIAGYLIKQRQSAQTAQQEAVAKRNQFLFEEEYKRSDPKYGQELRKGELEIRNLENPPLPDKVRAADELARRAGLVPGTPEYNNFILQSGQTGTNVTVNSGPNNSKFVEESDKAAATRLGTIVEQGNAAPQFMSDLNRLVELGSQIGTGKGAQVIQAIGPYAQALGIDVKGLDEGQAYQAIVDRLAPNMRPAGAGATSDFDARQYLSSLPALSRTPGGNAIVAQTLQALQENKIQAADIASQAQSGDITWQEAEKQIRAMANPYATFKKFKADLDDPKKVPTTVPGVTIRKIGD